MLIQVSEACHLAADRLQEEEHRDHPSYHDQEVEAGEEVANLLRIPLLDRVSIWL